MARAPKTEAPGTSGASLAKANFQALGWGAVENSNHDLGTDLWLMARDARRYDLGSLVGAQVKSGPSYFTSLHHNDAKELDGWWFADDEEHFEDWLTHSVPHIVVLQDLKTKISYWAHVTPSSVVSTGKRRKILVPRHQVVDEEHREALLDVAASKLIGPAWEGSAWNGAPEIVHRDLLRHAMIVPRVLAPHPNMRVTELTAEQALALTVLVRLENFSSERHQHLPPGVPSIAEAAQSTDWRWRFVAGLYNYLFGGEPEPLANVAAGVATSSDKAAGLVAAAAAYLECGQPSEAIKLLQPAVEADEHLPLDHAWLQAQLSRAYMEVGQLTEARDLALQLQRLRVTYPHELTAVAIAGSAARLVLTASDWGDVDLGDVITANDSAASWWRSHVLLWGLGDQADQQFIAWAGDEPSDSGLNELRAASLLSGFAADHGGWRRAAALNGRHQLTRTDPTTPPEKVSGPLIMLRLSGEDDRPTTAATQRIVLDGPAAAARMATNEIDLAKSTRTAIAAEMSMLIAAGDVLPDTVADQHCNWALEVLGDRAASLPNIKGAVWLEEKAPRLIAALADSLSDTMADVVIEHLLNLPPQEDQLLAGGWARIIKALRKHPWSDDQIRRAEAQSSDHHWQLEYALLAVAAEHSPSIRGRLLQEARGDDWRAMELLGDLRNLTSEDAAALATIVAAHLAEQQNEARNGAYDMGGINWGWYLAALNLCHPTVNRWDDLLAFFRDPAAHPDHLEPAVRAFGSGALKPPEGVAQELIDAFDDLARRPPFRMQFHDVGETARWAAQSLRESYGERDDHRLYKLLTGPPADRESAALVIARREDPTQYPTLLALAFDSSPQVRARAAEAIAFWAGRHVADEWTQETIPDLLADPGTRVARSTVLGLAEATDVEPLRIYERQLLDHISAFVRRRTQRALKSFEDQ
jgi:tetratricopeptide (TPR) repeat protein